MAWSVAMVISDFLNQASAGQPVAISNGVALAVEVEAVGEG